MHYSFIVNPTAGSGYAKESWQHLRSSIDKLSISYDAYLTKSKGHASYLANKIANSLPQKAVNQNVLVAVGGDGTVNEVLTGLMQSTKKTLPLAVIPCGKTNNFALAAGVSQNIDKALQQLLNTQNSQDFFIGHYQDMIKNQDGYFLTSLGIGFDARMNSLFNPSRKHNAKKPSSWSFFRRSFATLYNQQSFSINIDDGKSHHHFNNAFIAIACNCPYSGQALLVSPEASLMKQHIDLIVVERKNWLHTLLVLWQLLHGRISKSRFAHVFHSSLLRYSIDSLEFRQIDGNNAGNQFADLQLSTVSYPFWISKT